MKFNPEIIVNGLTSFVYSWIPALLILWFLIARKTATKLGAPLLGFLAGTLLSACAGHLNRFTSIHLFPGPESAQFFFMVGLVEELIKFIASASGIFLLYFKRWRSEFQVNWLAQSMSGALGFAAAENFIYGIDGQGGIARVIPLIAHTFFAIFWGLGLYKASFESKPLKSLFWILLGLGEGAVLHGIYDCIVSENIVSNWLKIVAWLALAVVIAALLAWHFKVIQGLKEKYVSIENPIQEEVEKREEKNDRVSKLWLLASIVTPGSGHLFARREIFTGLTFMTLGFLFPYIILRFALNEISGKILRSTGQTELNLVKEFALILAICFVLYFGIGLWSAWELKQHNSDLDKRDSKRRLSAFFPVSTLFFVSLLASFFLPVWERQKGKQDGEDKNTVIKEIPLGITWELQKETPPAPQQKRNTEVGNKDAVNSITVEQDPIKKPDKKDEKKQPDPSKDKPPSGVANSDSLDRQNLPDKLPQVGYIGVQLSEMILNQQIRPYIAFVYPGTSADRAGLKSGDFITNIDGKSSIGLNAFQVSNLVRGPLGSSVELTVYREGAGELKVRAFRTGTLFANDSLTEKQIR